MNKGVVPLALCAVMFLAGCTAQSDEAVAHNGCIESATDQLPPNATDINTSQLETTNVSEAMREVAENPLEPDPDDPVMYATAGKVWYKFGDQDRSVSVICTTEMLDGEPAVPIEAVTTPG